MKLNVLSIFLFLQAYNEDTQGAYQEGVNRMDDNVQYLKYQDIVKAIEKSKPAWLYGYTEGLPSPRARLLDSLVNAQEHCIYFTKQFVNDTNTKFTKHIFENKNGKDNKDSRKGEDGTEGDGFKSDGGEKTRKEDKYDIEKPVPLYGRFFKTTIINKDGQDDVRNTSNGIIVTQTPDEQTGERFKLLYSDDSDCSILRPLGKGPIPEAGDDQSYWTNTRTDCILLLSEKAARGPRAPQKWVFPETNKLENAPPGMPEYCQLIYKSFCGKDKKLQVVFDKDCPTIPNPLGC